MHILYLHQYFKTPEEGGAIRSYYIGKALAARGHELIMLSSWNGTYTRTETIAGMQVYYLPVPYSNNMSFWQRSQAFFKFLWLAKQQLDALIPADLVYATSTPLTIGLLALYAKQRYKIPYLFEVRDLWPEAPIQLGFIRNRLAIHTLRKLEKRLYRQASTLVALSPGIVAGIQAVCPGTQIKVVPNMADCDFFLPVEKPVELVKQWQLEGKFVISYTGAAGLANYLSYLLDAARACEQAQLPVSFLIAAEGSQLSMLKQEAAELQHVQFLPYGDKETVRKYLAVSDACYTSFGPQPVLQSCSPNKFFDGLAAGRLSIVNTEGWLKELVEEHGCGFYAPPQVPEEFVQRLLPYLQDPLLLRQAQANARRIAESLFSRERLATAVVEAVENLA